MRDGVVATAAFAIVLVSTLTGCHALGSATQCARGVDTAAAAVKGLIDGARTAKTPADICQWVDPSLSVSQAQLDNLKNEFVNEPDSTLTISVGDQMGSTVTVVVATRDGLVSASFGGSSDGRGKWTVAYGTFTGGQAIGPSSAASPSSTAP